jgi:hypothetical protein
MTALALLTVLAGGQPPPQPTILESIAAIGAPIAALALLAFAVWPRKQASDHKWRLARLVRPPARLPARLWTRGSAPQDEVEKPFVGRRIEKDESSCPSAVLARAVPYLDFTDDLLDSPSLRKVEDRSQDRRGDPLSSMLGRDKDRNGRFPSVVQLDIQKPNRIVGKRVQQRNAARLPCEPEQATRPFSVS